MTNQDATARFAQMFREVLTAGNLSPVEVEAGVAMKVAALDTNPLWQHGCYNAVIEGELAPFRAVLKVRARWGL